MILDSLSVEILVLKEANTCKNIEMYLVSQQIQWALVSVLKSTTIESI